MATKKEKKTNPTNTPASTPAPAATAAPAVQGRDTVFVALNHPQGINFLLDGGKRRVLIRGNANALRGSEKGKLPTGAFGLTEVSKADWEAIQKQYGRMEIFQSGLIFANDRKADAADEAEERAETRHGREPVDVEKDAQRMTLGELAMAYFKSNPHFHHETKRKIVYLLAGYTKKNGEHVAGVGEFLRDKYAEALTRQDLERLRDNCRERGAGNNTINKHQAYIRAILAWGVDQSLIHFNPWRDFRRLKVVRPIIHASIRDLQRLYPHLPEYLQWAVKTAFFLALRPGQVELFALTWDAFDWRRGMVFVRQGKSGHIKTVVPHPAYLTEARMRFEADAAAGIPLVCHRGKGQRVLSFRTSWLRACRLAGVHARMIYDISQQLRCWRMGQTSPLWLPSSGTVTWLPLAEHTPM